MALLERKLLRVCSLDGQNLVRALDETPKIRHLRCAYPRAAEKNHLAGQQGVEEIVRKFRPIF